jgi:hypothetical protein
MPMPMPKKANGGNFKVAGGDLTLRFESDGPTLVYVVCLWGPKPPFGGQRMKAWCTDTVTTKGGAAEVTLPHGMAMAGAQVTWSGGLIATREAQGRLRVSVEEAGGEASSYAYEYTFTQKNETETFYDGLNFA